MATTTLRPNGTTEAWTGGLTGGASMSAVLLDDSDASYASGSTAAGTVALGDFTLPAGDIIKSIAVRVRFARSAGASLAECQVYDSGIPGVPSAPWNTVTTSSATPITVTAATYQAAGLTDAQLDAAYLRLVVVNPLGTTTRLYEAYVDIVHVAPPVVNVTAPTGTLTDSNLPTIEWTMT